MNSALRTTLSVSLIAALMAGCANQGGGAGGGNAANTLPPNSAPGCKPLGPSKTQATVTGAAIGAVAGAVIGSSVSKKSSVGARNGLVLGAVAGGLVGSQMGSSIKTTEMEDGSVRLDIPGSVMFASGSAAINDGFKSTLDRVGKVIQEYCGLTAQVVGHTDNVGKPADNKTLSVNRAKSAVAHLTTLGVAPGRLSFDGLGADRPIADNSTDAGRQQNRRVEIFVRPPAN